MRQVETHLLCEQNNGRCWDTVFPSRAYCFSIKKCGSKAFPILLGSSSDPTYKPVALSHLAQVGPIRMDIDRDNQIKWVWDQVSTTVILKMAG